MWFAHPDKISPQQKVEIKEKLYEMKRKKIKNEENKKQATLQKMSSVNSSVDRVNVIGLCRTKDETVRKITAQLFDTHNFQDLMNASIDARKDFRQLGCFEKIDIAIDTSKSNPNGYEVTYSLLEKRYPYWTMQGSVGQNQNEAFLTLKTILPNVYGSGEMLFCEGSISNCKSKGVSLNFSSPFSHEFIQNCQMNSSLFHKSLSYKTCDLHNYTNGAFLELLFSPLKNYSYKIKLDLSWRNLCCKFDTKSFLIREHAGHTLKSSVIQDFSRDTRSKSLFPSEGSLLKWTDELAGIGIGDSVFLKNELHFETYKKLFHDAVLRYSFSFGILNNHLNHDNLLNICDQFFVGGPATLRGFEPGSVGTNDHGSCLGTRSYWTALVHLFAGLPLLRGSSKLEKYFKTQVFLNAGAASVTESWTEPFEINRLYSTLRLSTGAGIVFKLTPHSKFELNYCVPILFQAGDRPCHGLQFGFGAEF